MSEPNHPLDEALVHIDKALADFSGVSLASTSDVCDRLLDLRLLIVATQALEAV
jgi:elongation factor P--beta-lysine ligase